MEHTGSDHSNLNRYPLLRTSQVGEPKLDTLRQADLGGLQLTGYPLRYDADSIEKIGALAPAVLVVVDHIPTRWFVQAQHPGWLGIGASTQWNAMASFHDPHSACAQCLHPRDDVGDALIPTVAFVSQGSGLLLATYFARRAGDEQIKLNEHQVFMTPLRPESLWKTPVGQRADCPACGLGGISRRQGRTPPGLSAAAA